MAGEAESCGHALSFWDTSSRVTQHEQADKPLGHYKAGMN